MIVYAIGHLTELFNDFREQCLELMQKKNADYGNSWEQMRPESITDQILVKVLRIKQLEDLERSGEQPQVSEGIESELRDIANYAAFRWIKENEK